MRIKIGLGLKPSKPKRLAKVTKIKIRRPRKDSLIRTRNYLNSSFMKGGYFR